MWRRRVSRSTGEPYLVRGNETKWPETSSAATAYDGVVAAEHGPACTASKRMRERHNLWKRQLLARCVAPGSTVVDLACGRGGDIRKVMNLGATAYVGVDVSQVSVQEARRRAAGIGGMSVDLHEADLSIEEIPCAAGHADTVICMFALHYFNGATATVRAFLGEVARVLRPGGTFVATFPDHAYVRAALRSGERVQSYIRLEGAVPPEDTGLHARPCGHGYTFEFVGRTPPLREYIVYPPFLENEAGAVGLELERRIPAPTGSELYTALMFTRTDA